MAQTPCGGNSSNEAGPAPNAPEIIAQQTAAAHEPQAQQIATVEPSSMDFEEPDVMEGAAAAAVGPQQMAIQKVMTHSLLQKQQSLLTGHRLARELQKAGQSCVCCSTLAPTKKTKQKNGTLERLATTKERGKVEKAVDTLQHGLDHIVNFEPDEHRRDLMAKLGFINQVGFIAVNEN